MTTCSFTDQYPGPYIIESMRCGTENCFMVTCSTTEKFIAGNYFWDNSLICELASLAVAHALNAIHHPEYKLTTDGSKLFIIGELFHKPFVAERCDCFLGNFSLVSNNGHSVAMIEGEEPNIRHLLTALNASSFPRFSD